MGPDAYGGAGAFALAPIKKGELIEKGIVRVLPVDGNESPFLFTWSETEPRSWAFCSGAAPFYNMSADPNTHMVRYFDDLKPMAEEYLAKQSAEKAAEESKAKAAAAKA